MVKLICPDCEAIDFGTEIPSKADLLKHAQEKHALGRESRNIANFWRRQKRTWLKLVKTNDMDFDIALTKREDQWERFAEAPLTKRLSKTNFDQLHERRAWLMEIEDDSDESDGIAEDDPRGKETKEYNEKWVEGPGYAVSIRYHQSKTTAQLAREMTEEMKRATPGDPQGIWFHRYPTLEEIHAGAGPAGREYLFQNDFPNLITARQREANGTSGAGS